MLFLKLGLLQVIHLSINGVTVSQTLWSRQRAEHMWPSFLITVPLSIILWGHLRGEE